MYRLHDALRNQVISRHHTIERAVVADINFKKKRIKDVGDKKAVVPTQILDEDGKPIEYGHPEAAALQKYQRTLGKRLRQR